MLFQTDMSLASNVKTLLQSIGLYEAWVNQCVGNVKVFYKFGETTSFWYVCTELEHCC